MQAVPDIQAVFTEEEAEEKSFVYDIDGPGGRQIFAPQGNMGSIIRLIIGKDAGGKITMNHEILKVDDSVQEDGELAGFAKEYQTKLDRELGKVIAVADSDLPYGDHHESRFQETAIGNLIADAYRSYYHTDVAFANGGGIRASAKKGDFTLKDANSILPFGNKIVVAEVDGGMLQAALENSVAGVDKLAGGFLQVSGLSYTYNPAKPIGHRIEQAAVNGKPLSKEQKYKLALSGYMYAGGDKYTMFGGAKTIVGASEARTDVEPLVAYAEQLSTISAKTEGRIGVNGFADVTSDHWAAEAVYGLSGKGILNGVSEARFAPNQAVTRGEFAGLLARALGLERQAVTGWYGSGSADLQEPLTREEMAVILASAYQAKSGKRLASEPVSTFGDDGELAESAKAAVSGLAKEGVLSGRGQNLFVPKANVTRAEMAKVIWRLAGGASG
ncbi:5'-nucleotidase C-terminal domain-containing protein [Paenibacillus sp. P26]|nr:5'-nucleotidase C-terminal domain-containing protein [Paenibacillus sp. P26]UUZ92692.1 5'-nucleotidase C-terminal domain-containing protein [Paenibacillus sp. P25]